MIWLASLQDHSFCTWLNELTGPKVETGGQLGGCCYNLRGRAGEGAAEVTRSSQRGEEKAQNPVSCQYLNWCFQDKLTKTWKQIQDQCVRNPESPLRSMPPEGSRQTEMAVLLPTALPAPGAPCTWNAPRTVTNEISFGGRETFSMIEALRELKFQFCQSLLCRTFLWRRHNAWLCRILLENYHASTLWDGELARLDTGSGTQRGRARHWPV